MARWCAISSVGTWCACYRTARRVWLRRGWPASLRSPLWHATAAATTLWRRRALPHAVQVTDRWHLMENASRASAEAVRQSMRVIRQVIGATTLNPALLTAAERIQYEGYLRREDTNAAVLEQARAGTTIKEIVRCTGHSRGLVRQILRGQILRGQRSDVFRTRESSLELHLPWLDAQWSTGARNSAALWRQLKLQGFQDLRRVVSEWAMR